MIKLEVLDLCSYCSLFESQGDDKGPVEAGGTEVAIIIILCQHAPPPQPVPRRSEHTPLCMWAREIKLSSWPTILYVPRTIIPY